MPISIIVFLSMLLALLATVTSADVSPTGRRPVLLLPGFASSQLHAWKRHSCSHGIQKNLYRDVNVGDRIWVDAARILAQGDCWLRCMKLHMTNQSEVECKLRAADGLPSISELDPGFVTGPLSTIWRGLVNDLVEQFQFEPDEIVVAPYDWRLPPSKLQERDRYFLSLKRRIEHTVAMHSGRSGGVSGLVVIAHSMGNNIFRYFLAWLKHEVGRNHWQEWIDKHISAYFAVGAPLLGSSEALELLTSGLTQGLPLPQSEMRKLVVTFGAILSFLPIPSVPPTSHDSDVLVSVRHPSITDGSQERGAVERNYTSVDIASGRFFRDMAVRDPIFGDLEKIRQRFYVDDDVLDAFSPWERPPIAHVYAVYGTNLQTKYNYRYQDTDTAGHWYQVALENESGHRQVCQQTGDATVPYHSLSWAHTWLGAAGGAVNVTRAPQSVYFSSKQIKTFTAIRQGETHHTDYKRTDNHHEQCNAGVPITPSFFSSLFGRSAGEYITFYETTDEDAGGRTSSTSVWEIDGARHREILSSAAFLRELRTELRHLFDGRAGADKSARPPVIDSDCYWNYRQAMCEFPEFCQYRYVFGDVTLDQSCRLRLHPELEETQTRGKPPHPHPMLVDDIHSRNSGLTSTDAVCADAAACRQNGTPVVELPVDPWIQDDDMDEEVTTLVPRGLPGYCLVPCEYCLQPSRRHE